MLIFARVRKISITTITSTIYGRYSPQEYPLYSQYDIARALKVPRSTLHSWLKDSGQKPVISISDSPQFLNFLQLSEAFAIIYMRKTLKISLQKIRKASKYLKEKVDLDYPLIDPRIRVGTGNIYFERAKEMLLINATLHGQIESRDLIGEYIRRLDFKKNARFPYVLYPWIPGEEQTGETRKTIRIDPQIRFGQPTITGTGISVAAIQDRFEAGESMKYIANSYGIEREKVKDAIAYADATC